MIKIFISGGRNFFRGKFPSVKRLQNTALIWHCAFYAGGGLLFICELSMESRSLMKCYSNGLVRHYAEKLYMFYFFY